MERTNCTSWRGHRYQGRYDHRETPNPQAMECDNVRGREAVRLFADNQKLHETIYVRDVCVRCGSTIEREKAHA